MLGVVNLVGCRDLGFSLGYTKWGHCLAIFDNLLSGWSLTPWSLDRKLEKNMLNFLLKWSTLEEPQNDVLRRFWASGKNNLHHFWLIFCILPRLPSRPGDTEKLKVAKCGQRALSGGWKNQRNQRFDHFDCFWCLCPNFTNSFFASPLQKLKWWKCRMRCPIWSSE